MPLSVSIRRAWHEAEDVVTAATGPLLIVSSAIGAADIFANQTFSHAVPQLPAVWAIARALAVTLWLGVAFDYFLETRAFGWFVLSMALFAVDLQTAALFAFQVAHISDLGEWAFLQIPAADWVIEQATLGVVLIAVQRAITHKTERAQGIRRDLLGVTAAPVVRVPESAGAAFQVIERPEDDQEPQEPVAARSDRVTRRGDRGGASLDRARNVARVVAMLRADPSTTLNEIEQRIGVQRQAAVSYRREARALLGQQV